MTKRTTTQNSALHKYFVLLAEALNDAGLDVRKTMKEEFEIPWNETLVKELLWKQLQGVMTEKHSTTQLETHEVSEVYKVLDRHLASKFGVSVPFPSIEPPLLGEEND